MPRTDGVSCNSETELTRRSPRPRTVARWSWRVPIKPLTSCTLIVFAICFTLAQDIFNRLAALSCDLCWSIHFGQTVECCTDHVVWIGRTVRLCHDVGHAHHFENCAHRTAGNHASTVFSRLHQNRRCAVLAGHCVLQRAVFQGDLDHLATRFFHCLLHRNWHFFRLALAHADTTIAVTNDCQRREAHDTTALHHFGDTVDRDHFFAHAVIWLVALRFGLHFCHDDFP